MRGFEIKGFDDQVQHQKNSVPISHRPVSFGAIDFVSLNDVLVILFLWESSSSERGTALTSIVWSGEFRTPITLLIRLQT